MLGLEACKGMSLSVSQRGAERVSPVWSSPVQSNLVQNVQTPLSVDISSEISGICDL